MEEVLTTYWRTQDGLLYDPVEDTAEYYEAMVTIHRQLAEEFSADMLDTNYCPEGLVRRLYGL